MQSRNFLRAIIITSLALTTGPAWAEGKRQIQDGLNTPTAQEFGNMLLASPAYAKALAQAKASSSGQFTSRITTESQIVAGSEGGSYTSAVLIQVALLPVSTEFDGFVGECMKGIIEARGTEKGWEGGVRSVEIKKVSFRKVVGCGDNDKTLIHARSHD